MQYLQQQLEQVGIDVELEEAELARFVQQFVSGDYDTVYLGGFFGAADPDALLPVHHLQGRGPRDGDQAQLRVLPQPGGRSGPPGSARATDDDTARRAAWTSIWEAFATDLPYAFLYQDDVAWVTGPDVHGLEDPTTPDGVALPTINRWTPFYTNVYVTP